MKGLMQERPLNIPMIVSHAARLHPRKTVASMTAGGVRVATFAEVLNRARRLVTALRRLGVGPDDRVATFCWNHQQHLEAYVGVPCMGAILHTLNIRLFPEDLAYIVDHAQDTVAIVDKSLWPAWQKVAERVSCVRHVIVVDDAPGPAPDRTLDYETLVASAEPAEPMWTRTRPPRCATPRAPPAIPRASSTATGRTSCIRWRSAWPTPSGSARATW
jgi:fatty-acyl-CoA synthase